MKKRIFRTVLALVEAVILGLCFAIGSFFVISPNKTYATTSIQFLYDGAADGLDPNGNCFSADSIVDDNVINSALASLGWSDKYDTELIKKSLIVTGSYPKNILSQITYYESVLDYSTVRDLTVTEYYPTVYGIKLYDDFADGLKKSDLVELLGAIVDAYEQSFYDTYSHTYMTGSLDSFLSFDGHDYAHHILLLNTETDLIKNYCNDLYELQPSFVYDGVTFNDLAIKCESLQNNKLSKIAINITMNGLTSDAVSIINEYSYIIEQLQLDLAKQTESYDAVTALIESYERDSTLFISSGENFVKVESTSGETYDTLVKNKIALAAEISDINSEISEYQQRIADVRNNVSGGALYNTLDSDIKYAEEQLSKIKSEFDALAAKYDEKYVTGGTIAKKEIETSNNSIFSVSFIVTCIKCIGPFFVIALIAILIDAIASKIKPKNKADTANFRKKARSGILK